MKQITLITTIITFAMLVQGTAFAHTTDLRCNGENYMVFVDPFLAKFSGHKKSGKKMTDEIINATGKGCNLNGENLTDAVLIWAYLKKADLTDAILVDAQLTDADLSGAILVGADLTGADLFAADLSGADLSGADLRHAILIDADLFKAVLTGAKFNKETDFPGLDGWFNTSGMIDCDKPKNKEICAPKEKPEAEAIREAMGW